ncbi:transporter substrate-binding domain-containing protein [Ancylobacter mangrovi]|uniref:Transporter substrate-binding domain-containing protein n=1 Tax=Ancylobacter mangrovi TaxID=2972472 RepID=A0A9X2PIZ2_9HYPH|nr:transporter substrate-binding domain-containing protein [Ancylobacter mangrovi]MCS0496067.1 transporter substrate-binding domain-containing protein [Ancylobacter mangrovi]MCS0504514.1 transporter substrate-binding domain-containing protein [Ancylobacter mangrovi]
MAFAGLGHAEDLLAKVKAKGELTVGTELQFAPFDFIEDGKQAGMNKEIFAEIGKDLGVKVTFLDLPWPSVLPGLEAGKFDMVAGPATITKARMERYRFTSPIADATVAILKKKGDGSITKPQDIAGKKVGSGKATAQLAQLQEFAKTLSPEPTIQEYIDFSQSYADLGAGRIVAVANSLPNIAFLAKQKPDVFEVVEPPFGKPVYFGFIGTKAEDAKSLMDAVDKVIIAMKHDGRLAALQKKWFGTAMSTPDYVTEASF